MGYVENCNTHGQYKGDYCGECVEAAFARVAELEAQVKKLELHESELENEVEYWAKFARRDSGLVAELEEQLAYYKRRDDDASDVVQSYKQAVSESTERAEQLSKLNRIYRLALEHIAGFHYPDGPVPETKLEVAEARRRYDESIAEEALTATRHHRSVVDDVIKDAEDFNERVNRAVETTKRILPPIVEAMGKMLDEDALKATQDRHIPVAEYGGYKCSRCGIRLYGGPISTPCIPTQDSHSPLTCSCRGSTAACPRCQVQSSTASNDNEKDI